MRPKHRPPRPKHPKFTYFHRSGLRFGRFPAQRRSIGGVGRHRRAWPRCRWVAAGPGRASRQRTKPHVSTPGTAGVEGAGGTGGHGRGAGGWRQGQGGPRDRPLRAQLACGDLAGGPPPTGTHSGRTPQSSPAPQQDPTAPGTPVGATSSPAQRAPDNGYDSETSPRGSRRDRPR